MEEEKPKHPKKTLEELKQEISDHYYNEAKIMNDMLEAKLTTEEKKELHEFMLKHPYAKLVKFIQDLKSEHEKAEKTTVEKEEIL
jgi:hypothetical protein